MNAPQPSPTGNDAHCDDRLKTADRPAWLASLFAPADKRPALHALGAFAAEIAAVRGKVREPLAGELRLQWWIDAIEGEARGDVRGHPIASALIDAIRQYHLPRATLTAMIEARREDLYDDPIETLADYGRRADRIDGARVDLSAQILFGARDPAVVTAARHAGHLLAVADTIRALSHGATPLHMTVPLELLRPHGIGAAEVLVRRPSPPLLASLAALGAYAEAEAAGLRALRDDLPAAVGPALLTSSLARATIRRGIRHNDPFTTPFDLPMWRQQWLLWRASRRGGVL